MRFGTLTIKIAERYRIGLSTKVFKKPLEFTDSRPNILVLVDASGSMFTANRDYTAIGATLVFLKAAESVGIPCSAWGFNGKFIELKGWDEKLKVALSASRYGYLRDNNANAWNCDHAAVNHAVKMLEQKKGDKFLIVLSDGEPVACCGDSRETLTQAVAKATKAGIKMYGIGIQSNAVKQFYPDHVVIKDPKELPDILRNLFLKLTRV